MNDDVNKPRQVFKSRKSGENFITNLLKENVFDQANRPRPIPISSKEKKLIEENEKLKAELRNVMSALTAFKRKNEKLKKDNAKLMELVNQAKNVLQVFVGNK